MAEIHKKGLARSIGVSNFTNQQIERMRRIHPVCFLLLLKNKPEVMLWLKNEL